MTYAFGGLLVAGLVALAFLLPVPYVVFSPGPTADVLDPDEDIIAVEGAPTFPTDGQLDLTTISVTPAGARMDLVTALVAWFDPDQAVLPRESVYPDDVSTEEVREANAALFTASQDRAVSAALLYLDYEPIAARVVELVPDAPAEGVLEPADLILEVAGVPTPSADDVSTQVSRTVPGDEVEMLIERDGRERVVEVPTEAAPDPAAPEDSEQERAVVGVLVETAFPVDVTIDVTKDIGGSSAGLIFSLAVVDTLTEGSLLEGRHVAGTGEISPDGEVGPIGGIQQKIVAARDEGATVFLAPPQNCSAVLGADPGDMAVVPAATLQDAIDVLDRVAADGDLSGADLVEEADLPTCTEVVQGVSAQG